MPNDPLTDPVLTYLKEFIGDVRKLNPRIPIFEEFEWVEESDGSVRKTRVDRPFLGFHLEEHKKASYLYALAINAIEQDDIFGFAIGSMVGDEGNQMRFDCDIVFSHLLTGIAKLDGTFPLTKKAVSRQLSELRRYLTEPIMKNTLLIPLLDIKCYQIPFAIDDGIEIDRLSAEEIGWCVDSGVLRLFPNDRQVVMAEERMGLRIKIESTRKITKPEELEATSTERSIHVDNEMNRPHKFGSISRWKIADCVEDLLFVLRLARPEFIGTSGAMLVSERPTGRSSTWMGRPTRNFVNTAYEIDRSTGRAIRSYWRGMKEQAGKPRGLPSICQRRFNAAMDRVSLDDAVVDHLIAAEALFLNDVGTSGDRGELSFRLALRTARLLEVQPTERLELHKFIKAAYTERSRIAHGGSYRSTVKVPGRGTEVPLNAFVNELSSVMRRAFQKAIPMYRKDSKFGTSEYWDSLILGK